MIEREQYPHRQDDRQQDIDAFIDRVLSDKAGQPKPEYDAEFERLAKQLRIQFKLPDNASQDKIIDAIIVELDKDIKNINNAMRSL